MERTLPGWVRREFEPANPDFARVMRAGEVLQGAIHFLGMRLAEFGKGWAEMHLTHRPEVSNEMGPVHGGIVAAMADTTAGFATFSLVAKGENTVTVEYKINFLAPAQGETIVARGQVRRFGRSIAVVDVDVFAVSKGVERPCAVFLGTFMRVSDTSALSNPGPR
ncbi:MAG: PaaI family thioesterase [Alphaproteobacteria bacterium]|nr:PaaI family thioesterase [Alphaproteobacteria bacterium]